MSDTEPKKLTQLRRARKALKRLKVRYLALDEVRRELKKILDEEKGDGSIKHTHQWNNIRTIEQGLTSVTLALLFRV